VAAIALIDIGHRLEDEGVNRIIDFMTKHESFASPEEAAVEVAEYLPHRRQVNADNLRRNLRELPDGRWVWKHMFARRLRRAQAPVGGWRELLAGMGDEATTLTCPVLVLRGARSDVLSNEGAEEIASLIPDARLATVGSAGHHAAGDNPETTVDLVRDFLTETGS
jgi:pimeloyl-ACP methyl ester carboxylesterase